MYAIIDIETTGGSPVAEKITEIAIYIHNGEKVVEEFSTLINPEKKIPYYITNLTGISNAMVADAPKFYEVARKIVELTENKIFIAHNASFDYHFIRNEFKRLGFEYVRDYLCTVQLSRKLVPGLRSYSLGKLCTSLSIDIVDRHRASGDAMATVKLFEHLLSLSDPELRVIKEIPGLSKKGLHPNLDPRFINKLPEITGVYYFYNDKNELIYVGKSKNIRSRVLSHFRNYTSKKAIEMRNAIADIGFEKTGSELVALLKESHEIKEHKPLYNRSQRRTTAHYGVYYTIGNDGYIRFHVENNAMRNELPLTSFSTQKSAKTYMQQLVDEYSLCQKLCGLYPSQGACFHYEILECSGACIGKEPPEEYNHRATRVINNHRFSYDNFFILDEGSENNELAVVLVEKGKYLGYGFLAKDFYGGDNESLHACIHNYEDNRDIQQILRTYLRTHNRYKIVPFM